MHIHPQKPWRFALLAAATAVLASALTASQGAGFPILDTKDTVAQLPGDLRGRNLFTPDKGGRSGAAGDYGIDFGAGGSGPIVVNASTYNAAAGNDEFTIALWTKKYDTADGSAFWINYPPGTTRAFQAHIPWSNGNIYFDTSGCCDGATQRINAGIDTFPDYSGDPVWWNEWRLYVFTKKAAHKQIWVDGKLFLEGDNTAPLPTTMTELFIGSDGAGTGLFHGIVDDFSVYGTALNEASVGKLLAGTAPTALPATDKLISYFNFNDPPQNGYFGAIVPTPGTSSAAPDLVRVSHTDGTTPWDTTKITMTLDGLAVTPVIARNGAVVTVSYTPTPFFAAQTRHTATLTYPVGAALQTSDWSWEVAPYTTDVVGKHVGAFRGGSAYSVDKAGHSGAVGDFAVDFSRANTGPVFIGDAAWLNDLTAGGSMSLAYWGRKYDGVSSASSAFWVNSPSSNNGMRGFQAHAPWTDGNIYFDSAGCCNADQRIAANIDTFANYSGDPVWWNDWHHYVFLQNATTKQIWIDGKLFLEGADAAALKTDIVSMAIGSAGDGGNPYHGMMDDFAIFGAALPEASIVKLAAGNPATTLPAADKLAALFNFNDIPPGGLFLSFTPANGATAAGPNIVQVKHQDGTVPWDLAKVTLSLDGSPVAAAVTRDGNVVTVKYNPSPLFASKSDHTAVISYPDGAGTGSYSWKFTVGAYTPTKDVIHSYVGVLTGPAAFSADKGGKSGAAGDYGIELGTANAAQSVHILDGSFVNSATAADEVSFSIWQNLHQISDSALIWVNSPSSSGGQRGFSVHTPWSNSTLYYDTAGCCDAATQRINAGIDTFGDYSGDVTWWQQWHHFVVQKKGSTKEIWIDGKLFLTGDNTGTLPSDVTDIFLGFDPPDNATLRGVIDDFAVFSKALNETDINKIKNGTSPKDLPAANGLLAYWSFNELPVAELDADVTAPGDLIVSSSANTDSPATEQVPNVIDNQSSTKYLNFLKLNTGFTVTPKAGASILSGLTLTSANDAPERDPATYKIEGSNDGTTFTLVAEGSVPAFSARFTKQSFSFANSAAYKVYRVTFPTVANAASANSMQIAEVELLGKLTAPKLTWTSSGPNLTITYTGTLQSATAAEGPYTDVAGATSPSVQSTAGGAKFFRARQ